MKLLFVILDGAGDELSALEAADMPNIDAIAARSRTGMLVPIEGVAPESDQAMMALLGYDPYKYYTGRGPLEAAGAGIKINKGDIVFRGNFAFVVNDKIKETSVKMAEKENRELCRLLNEKINIKDVSFTTTKDYRFALVLSKAGLSPMVQNTHPGYDVIKNHVSTATDSRSGAETRKCMPLDEKAKGTAHLVNEITEKAHKILLDCKVNYILLRGAGSKLPELPALEGSWCMLADSHADNMIGRLAGMDVIEKPEDDRELAQKVISLFGKYDNICVQIKSPDKYSHNKDFRGKVNALEDIDRNFFSVMKEIKGITVAVTADHATSSKNGTHIDKPVPLLITANSDGTRKFCESACSKGSLGTLPGKDLMNKIREIQKNHGYSNRFKNNGQR